LQNWDILNEIEITGIELSAFDSQLSNNMDDHEASNGKRRMIRIKSYLNHTINEQGGYNETA